MREGKTDTVGRKLNCEEKPKVAFICVHNSCRSQIAEALGKKLASDVFESYSAGTETKPQINQDAVRIMKRLYGIDMEQTLTATQFKAQLKSFLKKCDINHKSHLKKCIIIKNVL